MPETLDPAYTIRVVPQDRFVEIVMRGFWTQKEFLRFDAELRAELRALPAGGCPIGEQVTLFDLTGFQVQGQDVILGLTGMANDASIGSRRSAMLLTAGLLKLQARRVAPDYGLFDTRATALAWLGEAVNSEARVGEPSA